MKFAVYLLSFLGIFILMGCPKNTPAPKGPDNSTETDLIYATYLYPSGQNPNLSIDPQTSSMVHFLYKNNLTTDSFSKDRVYMKINDVYFQDGSNLYIIDPSAALNSINPSVLDNNLNTWGPPDSETFIHIYSYTNLQCVLVLDYSGSLGPDRAILIKSAQNFCDSIKKIMPNAKIGLEIFADTIHEFNLSPNIGLVKTFMQTESSKIVNQNSTPLYAAVAKGLNLIDTTDKKSTKAIIVFTDGYCNASYNNQNYDPGSNIYISNLVTQYRQSGVRTFCLGLNGKTASGADVNTLNLFSQNGSGKSIIINGATQIGTAFNDFVKDISTIYYIQYDRNNNFAFLPAHLKFSVKTLMNK